MLLSVPVVKILKKIAVTGKIWEKAGDKLLRDLTEKSVNFSTFGNFQHQAFASFWRRGSINVTSPIGEKKIHDHRRKTRENDNFLMKQSPFLSPNFMRGSTVVVIPHNVELCKQYCLQECLLLIRKSCN